MTRLWLAIVPLLALTADIAVASSLRHLANASSLALYLPNCYIETGFDYEGNDIKNVPSKAAEGCCDECIKVDGCKAWSWSNYNGGTCWLKSGRGRIIVNANVKSSLLFEGNYPTCQLSADVDFVGNDIGQAPSANAEGCCDKCHSFLGCRAYSWTDYQGGTCWLKSSRGQAITKKGVKSAEAYPVPNYYPVCAQEVDVDYVGADIGSAASASPTGCCAICSGIRTCSAYSWTNQNGGTCWLKNRKAGTIKKAGVISSTVRPGLAYTCDTETGIDYQDNDISNVPSIDPDFCCTVCSETTGCKAYTWSDYNSGTCWLKSAKGAAVRTGKTKSGVPRAQ